MPKMAFERSFPNNLSAKRRTRIKFNHMARSRSTNTALEHLNLMFGFRNTMPLSLFHLSSQCLSRTGMGTKPDVALWNLRTSSAICLALQSTNLGEIVVHNERRMSTNHCQSTSRIKGHL